MEHVIFKLEFKFLFTTSNEFYFALLSVQGKGHALYIQNHFSYSQENKNELRGRLNF